MVPGSTTQPGYLYHEPFFDIGKPSIRKGNLERFNLLVLHEDFEGKKVLDVGCSAGYFSFASLMAGARAVHGVDLDPEAINACKQQREDLRESVSVGIAPPTFEVRDPIKPLIFDQDTDVVLLLSVIPWIMKTDLNAGTTLSELSKIPTAYVELMYEGDGRAGMVGIRNDREAHAWLTKYWKSAHPIGWTAPNHSPARRRTIWRCSSTPVPCYETLPAGGLIGAQAEVFMDGGYAFKRRRNESRYDPNREALALSALREARISPILVEERPQELVLTRLRGRTLQNVMGAMLAQERLPAHEIAALETLPERFEEIAEALVDAGVRHNDVRPENLIVGVDGRIYLIDFGWAQVKGIPLKVPDTINPAYRAENDRGSFKKIMETLCKLQ